MASFGMGSAWVRQHLQDGILDAQTLEFAENSRPPSIEQCALRMLRYLSHRFPMGRDFQFGEWWVQNSPQDSGKLVASPLKAIGWCRDLAEEDYLFHQILKNHFGWISSIGQKFHLAPNALVRLEAAPDSQATIGFCAMWFSPEVLQLWSDVIEPAIRESGYEPLRIDGKEHNGKIDDEIMASIRASKFVVSDFTGSRGGVYYEAGFAHGLGFPVIFMCREGDALHFDVRQYNCIFWTPEELPEARSRLKNRILATLGQGPLKTQ